MEAVLCPYPQAHLLFLLLLLHQLLLLPLKAPTGAVLCPYPQVHLLSLLLLFHLVFLFPLWCRLISLLPTFLYLTTTIPSLVFWPLILALSLTLKPLLELPLNLPVNLPLFIPLALSLPRCRRTPIQSLQTTDRSTGTTLCLKTLGTWSPASRFSGRILPKTPPNVRH